VAAARGVPAGVVDEGRTVLVGTAVDVAAVVGTTVGGVPVAEGSAVAVGGGVPVTEGSAVAVGAGVFTGVAVATGATVSVGLGVSVGGTGVSVGVGVSVGGTGVSVGVGVSVGGIGVFVGVGVSVGVLVGVFVGIGVLVGVFIGVGVGAGIIAPGFIDTSLPLGMILMCRLEPDNDDAPFPAPTPGSSGDARWPPHKTYASPALFVIWTIVCLWPAAQAPWPATSVNESIVAFAPLNGTLVEVMGAPGSAARLVLNTSRKR